MGFNTELMYPNQVIKLMSLPEGQHSGQKGMITYIKKKGNQQTTNTPMMIPNVLAALLSLDREILCFSSMNWYMNPGLLGSLNTTLGLGFEFEMVMVVVELKMPLLLSEVQGFEFLLWDKEEFSALSVRESSWVSMGLRVLVSLSLAFFFLVFLSLVFPLTSNCSLWLVSLLTLSLSCWLSLFAYVHWFLDIFILEAWALSLNLLFVAMNIST